MTHDTLFEKVERDIRRWIADKSDFDDDNTDDDTDYHTASGLLERSTFLLPFGYRQQMADRFVLNADMRQFLLTLNNNRLESCRHELIRWFNTNRLFVHEYLRTRATQQELFDTIHQRLHEFGTATLTPEPPVVFLGPPVTLYELND